MGGHQVPAPFAGSPQMRRELLRVLTELRQPQFEQVLYLLQPPAGLFPSPSAPQLERVAALLTWAEGPGGCRLVEIQRVLEEDLGIHLAPATSLNAPGPLFGGSALEVRCNAPRPPNHFLERPEELAALKALILDNDPAAVAVTATARGAAGAKTAVQGMGGIGKSVLAAALCWDQEVQQAFPHGIFWIPVGQDPALSTLQLMLARWLGEVAPVFDSLEAGRARLTELLADRRCLVVLDDVWNVRPGTLFGQPGLGGRLLVTTRNAAVATALGAKTHQLEVLSWESAYQLVADWAGVPTTGLPPAADVVVRECGRLPLALALVGALVRDGWTWEDVAEALRAAELHLIEHELVDYPHRDLLRAIEVSVEALDPDDRERYVDLAVFPEDATIPQVAVLTLWEHAALTTIQGKSLLYKLASRSLLSRDREGRVSLHDLQHDYVRARAAKRPHGMQALHQQLVTAYSRKTPNPWNTILNDGYYFQWFPFHLREAGQFERLESLLLDYRWLSAKLHVTDPNALASDFDLAPHNPAHITLQQALRLSAHVLAQEPASLPSQLTGRLLGHPYPAIGTLLEEARINSLGPWLRPLAPCLTMPGGSLVRTFQGHRAGVNSVIFTSDGRALSTSDDCTVKLWDLQSGACSSTYKGHTARVSSAAIVPGGRFISASDDCSLKLWNLYSGLCLQTLEGHTAPINDVVLTQDNYPLSASDDHTLKLWDLNSGACLRSLEGHTDIVNAVALFAPGSAISASHDHTLKLWDLHSGECLRTLEGHADWVNDVVCAPGGRALSASNDKTIRLWELESGTCLRILEGHTTTVSAVAFVSEEHALSASQDQTLRLWDLKSGTCIRTFEGHTAGVNALAITPDGHILSAAWDSTLKLWDRSGTSPRPFLGHSSGVTDVAFTTKDHLLSASNDECIKLWDLLTGTCIRTLSGHTDGVNVVLPVPQDCVLSAADDHTFRLWNLFTGTCLHSFEGHDSGVSALVVTPNGYVLTASWDHTVKLWDVKSGTCLHTFQGHTDVASDLAITSDGFFLSASWDQTLKLWDLSSGTCVRTFESDTPLFTVCIAPEGRFLTAGDDGTIQLWTLNSGTCIHTFAGHSRPVSAVLLLPEAHFLSASDDHTLKLWNLNTGKCVSTFVGEHRMACIAIAQDGVTIAAGDDGGRIYWFELEIPAATALSPPQGESAAELAAPRNTASTPLSFSSQMITQAYTALLSVFPDPFDITLLLRTRLNARIEPITLDNDAATTVLEVLLWAVWHGRGEELLQAAAAEHPDSAALQSCLDWFKPAQD